MAQESRRQWKSGRRVGPAQGALQHASAVHPGRPISARRGSEWLHRARMQHLLRGCACSRQTKSLAHGCPSAIWGRRSMAPFIGRCVAERLPEIDMRPHPLPAPACNGTREPMTWGFADGCSIRHLHTSLSVVTLPTAEVPTEITAIGCFAFTRQPHSLQPCYLLTRRPLDHTGHEDTVSPQRSTLARGTVPSTWITPR